LKGWRWLDQHSGESVGLTSVILAFQWFDESDGNANEKNMQILDKSFGCLTGFHQLFFFWFLTPQTVVNQ
jgi:hypothetical protein